jgi:hypothetical protein
MTTPSFRSLVALAAVPVLVAMLALGSAGSGGSDDDPEPTRSPPPGKYEMTVAEGDAPAALAFLAGDWTMEIEADGGAIVTHESGQTVVGRITVAGSELTFRDIGGQLACLSPTESGRYTWAETATTLEFALVSDGCDGRRFVLLHKEWTKS